MLLRYYVPVCDGVSHMAPVFVAKGLATILVRLSEIPMLV